MLLIDRRGRILVVVLEGEWSEFRTLEGFLRNPRGLDGVSKFSGRKRYVSDWAGKETRSFGLAGVVQTLVPSGL